MGPRSAAPGSAEAGIAAARTSARSGSCSCSPPCRRIGRRITLNDAHEIFGSDQVERSRAYHRPLYRAAIGTLVLELVLLAALAFSPLGDLLFRSVDEWSWWAATAVFAAEVVILGTLVRLPLRFWAGYVHEHAWGLSPQSLGGWAGDQMKALVVGILLVAAAATALVGSARALPSAWPILAAAGAALAVLLLTWAAPVLLEPLFSRVRPLADAELAAELRALGEASGVPLHDVLVSDASRRTRKLNAYVSGLGRTRRLVLFDTLVTEAEQPEVRVVVAHELGHRHEQHLEKGVALGMVGAALFVVLLWAALSVPGLRTALGVTGAEDPRVVPFVLLAGTALEVLVMPFGAALSRQWERQADRFSIDLTGDAESFTRIHRELAIANLSDVDPPRAIYLAFFTHPTAPERIRAALRPRAT